MPAERLTVFVDSYYWRIAIFIAQILKLKIQLEAQDSHERKPGYVQVTDRYVWSEQLEV